MRPDQNVIDAAQQLAALREQLEAVIDDPEAIRDTIEGESTDLELSAEAACMLAKELKVQAKAARNYAAEVYNRAKCFEGQAEHLITAVQQALEIAGIKKIKTGAMTISLREGKPKVIVTEEALIPARFWKPADPVLDKKALKDALDAGDVAGAVLSNPGMILTIRVA